jgi:lipopolysaccharide transport system permease protein
MSCHLPKTIYTPESSLGNPLKMLRDMWFDVASGRGLAMRLAERDIKAQYRQAFLGILWALILPLANTATWIFLNRTGIVSVAETSLPYPIFVFTGTMVWAIFMDALNAPLAQTTAAKSMLAKINFPREALIMSGILQTLFNSSIKIFLVIIVLTLSGIYPDWHLLLFPFAALSMILLGTTVGLLITPIGLLYTDVGKGIPLVMQFLMFVSPVVFPAPTAGWAAKIFEFNPLTPLILVARDWLTGAPTESICQFVAINLLVLVVLLAVSVVYRLAMPIMIERIGS